MHKLISTTNLESIPAKYRHTPIGLLLEYHNLGRTFDSYQKAELLIGTCMDNRITLRIPENFAYVLRVGGANLRYVEFQVSYAIAVGQISYLALIGHSHCGMVNLFSRKESFIDGLINTAGWDRKWAEDHFTHFAPMFEIGNEVDFILSETRRLRQRYPKVLVAPLMYLVEDKKLYLIEES